jgi:hypothetical protein
MNCILIALVSGYEYTSILGVYLPDKMGDAEHMCTSSHQKDDTGMRPHYRVEKHPIGGGEREIVWECPCTVCQENRKHNICY